MIICFVTLFTFKIKPMVNTILIVFTHFSFTLHLETLKRCVQ